jgi:hypothetical protein
MYFNEVDSGFKLIPQIYTMQSVEEAIFVAALKISQGGARGLPNLDTLVNYT